MPFSNFLQQFAHPTVTLKMDFAISLENACKLRNVQKCPDMQTHTYTLVLMPLILEMRPQLQLWVVRRKLQ